MCNRNVFNLETGKVICIVPAKNEQETIYACVSDLRNIGFRVLCIDDGSSDDTALIAKSAGAVVVQHSINLGQGAAIETGIEVIRRRIINCSYIATFDADGQHHASDLLQFVEILDQNPDVGVVLGSRFLNSSSKIPRVKSLFLKLSAKLSRVTLKLQLTDRHNGLRMFRTEHCDDFRISSSGYDHADEFLRIIKLKKIKFVEAPVKITYFSDRKGQPLINGVKIFIDNILRSR